MMKTGIMPGGMPVFVENATPFSQYVQRVQGGQPTLVKNGQHILGANNRLETNASKASNNKFIDPNTMAARNEILASADIRLP